jgi:hypothetical protein
MQSYAERRKGEVSSPVARRGGRVAARILAPPNTPKLRARGPWHTMEGRFDAHDWILAL